MSAAPSIAARIDRARFRAWHRGTREADLLIGGFFDAKHRSWDEPELAWFEEILDADETDVLAWAMSVRPGPGHLQGEMMVALQKLDFIPNY